MKNINVFLILIFIFTLSLTNVNALSCSNAVSKDLSQKASHIKVIYEVIDNSEEKEITVENNTTTYKVPNFNFEFTVYNLTDDLYMTIKEDVFNEIKTIYYGDTANGEYTFNNYDMGQIYNYAFVIYSNNSDCQGQTIRTIRLVKPKYNAYSEFAYCKNSSNYYCQKFVEKDLGLSNADDFLNKISTSNKTNSGDKKDQNDDKSSLNTKWSLYIIAGGILVTLIIITIIVLKKLKDKKRWGL